MTEISKDKELNLTEDNLESLVDRYDRNAIFTTGTIDKMEFPTRSFLDKPVPIDFPKKITELLVPGPSININTLVSQEILPLLDLMSSTVLKPFYTGFNFFKGDIKVTFVLNTTPMTYGALLISWIPYDNFVVAMENSEPYILDVASSSNFELIIPYCSPHPHYSFSRVGEGNPQQQPKVRIEGMGVNKMDSTVPSSIMQVYYSWTNLTMMGPAYKRSVSTYIAQSGTITPYAAAGATVIAAGNVAWNLAREVPHYMNTVNAGIKTFRDYKNELGEAYGGVSESIQNLLGEYGTQEADPATEEFKQGYSSKRVRSDVFGDISTTSYIPSVCTTGLDTVTRPPVNLCDPLLEHKMLDMLSIPCVRTWYDFATVNDYKWMPTCPLEPIPDTNALVTFADSIVSMFRYWRGSMDLCFKFYTSPLISARFEIQWFFANGRKPKDETDLDSAMFYKEFIEVKGSTTHYLHLPWMYMTDWHSTWSSTYGEDGANFQCVWGVRMALLNISNSGSLTPHVYVVVLQAPGSDFQVRSLCSPVPTWVPATRKYKPQCRVRDAFIGKTPIKPRRYRLVEDGYTMEGMARRFSARVATITAGTIDISLNRNNSSYRQDFDIFDAVLAHFAFVRGNIRVRIDNTVATGPAFVGQRGNRIALGDITPQYAEPPGNGQVANMKSVFPILEFEQPALTWNEWMYYTNVDQIIEPVTNLVSAPTLYYVAAGAGFGVAFPVPLYHLLKEVPFYFFSAKALNRTDIVRSIPRGPVRARKSSGDEDESSFSFV